MKVLKGIFFFIMGLIMAGCAGILICALNPSLTAMLAERVESAYPAQSAQQPDTASGPLSGDGDQEGSLPADVPQGISVDGRLGTDAGNQPGIDAGWLDRADYERPSSQSVEVPDSVSGRAGYEPVQEEAQQIDEEEADSLSETAGSEDVGSGLAFDEEDYPYYAMLEPDMQRIYCQIYANALSLTKSFAPVTDVSVSRLKTVFEAVYNDHPELFWLETGYSCKYLRSGRCAEITLKFNRTADSLDEARAAFEGAAGNIVAQAQGLGSDYEKERYVHDALMEQVEYDVGAPMNQSAYSALVGGRSVCAGYARAFQYMMQLMGIPCYYCTGFAGEDHAWDIVKIDGTYCNVDVTWDDTDSPTYDYFNKSDRELSSTHMRTGLSVYLPACADSGEAVAPPAAGTEGGAADLGEPDGDSAVSDLDISDLINPNPIEPLTWQKREKEEPPVAEEPEDREQENLDKAGVTADQVRDTLEEYYADCQELLKEAGTGYGQFVNVIPESLWSAVERAYNSGSYWGGYVEPALKGLGAQYFAIQLQVEDLGGGYYRLYHNIYTD